MYASAFVATATLQYARERLTRLSVSHSTVSVLIVGFPSLHLSLLPQAVINRPTILRPPLNDRVSRLVWAWWRAIINTRGGQQTAPFSI